MIITCEDFTNKTVPPIRYLGPGNEIISPIQPTVMGVRIDFSSVVAITDARINWSVDGDMIVFGIYFNSDIHGGEGSSMSFSFYPVPYPGPGSNVEKFEEYIEHNTVRGKEEARARAQTVVDHLTDLWERVKTLEVHS